MGCTCDLIFDRMSDVEYGMPCGIGWDVRSDMGLNVGWNRVSDAECGWDGTFDMCDAMCDGIYVSLFVDLYRIFDGIRSAT